MRDILLGAVGVLALWALYEAMQSHRRIDRLPSQVPVPMPVPWSFAPSAPAPVATPLVETVTQPVTTGSAKVSMMTPLVTYGAPGPWRA